MIKPMVLQGQIWKDFHGDYVYVDEILNNNYVKEERVSIERLHDNKKITFRISTFLKSFKIHKQEENSIVGKVLTDIYNDFFLIESYLQDEECYLLRNVKSSLVEIFSLDEIDKYFKVYEYDQEG